ncbi:MAG: NAD(P)-dependent oxidoreductase [Candidatus Baltobacteraceae bacterium]
MKQRVAFLGLGAMGVPMARNVARGGFPLVVWNRTRANAMAFASGGISVADSPREAAARAEVVMICVPSSPEVRDLLTRSDGILAGAAAGTIVVDCSTIDPNASIAHHAMCAERGVAMLEAPLSGGTIGAEAGTLTLMVGGEAAVLERARPVLATVGKNIFLLGPAGAGQVTKLCNNLIFAAQMIGVAEAYALVVRAGLDPAKVTAAFEVSTADCTAVRGRVPVAGLQPGAPPSNEWRPGFATEWMAKDLDLVAQYAKTVGVPALQASLDHQLMRLAMAQGYAKLDLSIVGKMLQDWTAKDSTAS